LFQKKKKGGQVVYNALLNSRVSIGHRLGHFNECVRSECNDRFH